MALSLRAEALLRSEAIPNSERGDCADIVRRMSPTLLAMTSWSDVAFLPNSILYLLPRPRVTSSTAPGPRLGGGLPGRSRYSWPAMPQDATESGAVSETGARLVHVRLPSAETWSWPALVGEGPGCVRAKNPAMSSYALLSHCPTVPACALLLTFSLLVGTQLKDLQKVG